MSPQNAATGEGFPLGTLGITDEDLQTLLLEALAENSFGRREEDHALARRLGRNHKQVRAALHVLRRQGRVTNRDGWAGFTDQRDPMWWQLTEEKSDVEGAMA